MCDDAGIIIHYLFIYYLYPGLKMLLPVAGAPGASLHD